MSYKCWKCCGEGKILTYSFHVNGICFACNGTGKVKYIPKNKRHLQAPIVLTGESLKKAEWIVNAKPDQWEKLTDQQIVKAHDFVHAPWVCMHPGMKDAFEKNGGRERFNQYQCDQMCRIENFVG